jgi:hypothetical protein
LEVSELQAASVRVTAARTARDFVFNITGPLNASSVSFWLEKG